MDSLKARIKKIRMTDENILEKLIWGDEGIKS